MVRSVVLSDIHSKMGYVNMMTSFAESASVFIMVAA